MPLGVEELTSGYIKVDRDIFTDPSFAEEAFCERLAWVWLMSEAAWQPRERRIGSTRYLLQRGQLVASLRFIAERWQWSHPTVRRYLLRLVEDGKIQWETETPIGIITICNYDDFQGHRVVDETVVKQTRSTDVPNKKHKENKLTGENAAASGYPLMAAPSSAQQANEKTTIVLSYRERLLREMGCAPSGEIRPGGKRLGNDDDMNLASTWVSELGLTEEETLVVVRSVMARKRDGKPPNSFSYFSAAMTRFSAKKQAKLEKHQRKAAQEKEARDVDVSRARKASEIGAKVVPGNAVRDRITASVAERILREVGLKSMQSAPTAFENGIPPDESPSKHANRLDDLPKEHPYRTELEKARNQNLIVQLARADACRPCAALRPDESAQAAEDVGQVNLGRN